MILSLERIISGGQTGVDRCALDWAIDAGIPHGGWCPQGRRAEDGPIPARYRLLETPASSYATRTEWNIRDSDVTIIFSSSAQISGGTALTQHLAIEMGKPLLHLYGGEEVENTSTQLRDCVQRYDVKILNIAGPRSSQGPDLCPWVRQVLDTAFNDRFLTP